MDPEQETLNPLSLANSPSQNAMRFYQTCHSIVIVFAFRLRLVPAGIVAVK